jgi:cell division septation protein DedD
MGPLPDHADLDLPVDTRPRTAAATQPEARPDPLASIRQSDLYAPPPSLQGARTLFYEAELGSFQSKQAAEQVWGRLARSPALATLNPRYAATGTNTRLSAGPLGSKAAVDALCVELSSLAGACRPVVPVRAY